MASRQKSLSELLSGDSSNDSPSGLLAGIKRYDERRDKLLSSAPEITKNSGMDILAKATRFQPPVAPSPNVKPVSANTTGTAANQRLMNQEIKLGEDKQKQSKVVSSPPDWLNKLTDKYEESYNNTVGKSALGKGLNTLTKADQAVQQFKAGALDTSTFGATQGLARVAAKATPGGTENLTPILNQQVESTPYKVGEFAGYLPSGALIERAGAKALAPLASKIGNNVARGAVTTGLIGAADAAAQELGDVAFREKTFDPLNVAIGGAIGGGLGAAVPAIGNALRNSKLGKHAQLNQSSREIIEKANQTPNEAINASASNQIMPGAVKITNAKATGLVPEQPIQTKQLINEPSVNISKTPETPSVEVTPEINEIQKPKSNWFSDLFGTKGVGFSPFGSNKGTKMLTTEDQLVRNPIKNDIQGAIESGKATARAAYQNTVDFLSPLKKINKQTYDAAMDASRANNLANTIITDKFIDNQGNVIGNSLKDIISNTGRGNAKAFDDYLIVRHAITRMQRGEKVFDDSLGMTVDTVKNRLETLEKRYPQFKELGEEWNKYNQNMINNAVNEGLISAKARDEMFKNNPNYAGMRREFTRSEKLAQPKFGGTGTAFSGQKAPIKEYGKFGSQRKIVSPARSAMETAYAFKNAELRNRTMQEIVKSIQMDPNGMKGIAEIVKKENTSYHSLDEALRTGGSDEFIEMLDNDFKNLFQKTKAGEENIVRAMVKGNPVYVKINDPEAAKALLGLGHEQATIVTNMMNKLSRATKRSATGLFAPMFAVKNLTADTVQAAIQSPNAVKHIFVDLPVSAISSIGDTFNIPGMGKLAEEFRRAGGEYSALLRGDRAVNRNLEKLRREPLLSPKGIGKGVTTLVKSPFKAMEKVADVTENLNRMAAYRRSLVGKERTPEAVREAINAARESTVNFSRRGYHSNSIETVIPYQNAAIQSIQRLGKQIVEHPVKTLAGVSTLVVGPKLYEYAAFNNDPDYQKLPARERYRNLIVSKNDDGTFNKVPMPPEYNAMGAFVTDVMNSIIEKDPQAFKGTLDALANAFTPPIVSGALEGVTQGGGADQSIKGVMNSTITAPFNAITGNQSFTGAPIVSKQLEGLPRELQYDERTSKVAKWIGKQLDMAPVKVDYMLRAYGGDPARLLLPLTSDVGMGTPKQTLLKNFIVDPVFTNTLTNDFYGAKEEYTKAENANKQRDVPFPSWYDERMADLLTKSKKGSPNKQLSELNSQKRLVQADKSLTATAKASKIREIQGNINDIYVDINAKLQQSGYKFPSR